MYRGSALTARIEADFKKPFGGYAFSISLCLSARSSDGCIFISLNSLTASRDAQAHPARHKPELCLAGLRLTSVRWLLPRIKDQEQGRENDVNRHTRPLLAECNIAKSDRV